MARELLDTDFREQRIPLRQYDLSVFLHPFTFPTDPEDGIESVRVDRSDLEQTLGGLGLLAGTPSGDERTPSGDERTPREKHRGRKSSRFGSLCKRRSKNPLLLKRPSSPVAPE